jgi:hypothetical protein
MSSNAELYTCHICGVDDHPLEDGVATCAAHFLCNDCLAAQFEVLATQPGLESFPARCCFGEATETTLRRQLAEGLLPPEVLDAYAQKEVEFYVPQAIRLHCSDCRKFLHPKVFYNEGPYSIAKCDCGTITCVGCKGLWQKKHRCGEGGNAKPAWMPEYSADFRIKSCPQCHLWIEHKEACNHMTCNGCRYQWCWVCRLPWDSFHVGSDDAPGCPMYGDPAYDEEGYETNTRGLHRDTGLDRDGRDRLGHLPNVGLVSNDAADAVHDQNEELFDLEDNNFMPDGIAEQAEWPQDELLNAAPLAEAQDDEEEDAQEDDVEYRAPVSEYDYYQLFTAGLCRHFLQPGTVSYRQPCSICRRFLHERTRFSLCSPCGLLICPDCLYDFRPNSVEADGLLDSVYGSAWNNQVSVIQWAEDGETPFKAERRGNLRQLYEQDTVPYWSAALMFRYYECLYTNENPFTYHDFGIQKMFEDLESEMLLEDSYVVVENVGIPGLSMSFNLANNRFFSLAQDEQDGAESL